MKEAFANAATMQAARRRADAYLRDPGVKLEVDTHRVDDQRLATMMPGFYWETIYGDYARAVGYALKKTPIQWERLTPA